MLENQTIESRLDDDFFFFIFLPVPIVKEKEKKNYGEHIIVGRHREQQHKTKRDKKRLKINMKIRRANANNEHQRMFHVFMFEFLSPKVLCKDFFVCTFRVYFFAFEKHEKKCSVVVSSISSPTHALKSFVSEWIADFHS